MARKSKAMQAVGMTIYIPSRRPESYVIEYHDPTTWAKQQKTPKTLDKREAYAIGAEIASKAVAHISVHRLTWEKGVDTYKRLHIRKTGIRNQEAWTETTKHIASFGAPRFVDDITSLWVAEWQVWLATTQGLAVNSVAFYSRYLRGCLNWLKNHDLLERAPHVEAKCEQVPRGKAVTPTQFKRLLEVALVVRPKDTDRWDRFLRALARCNLRIDELRRLSWDRDAPIRLDTSEIHPLIRFTPKSTKSRKRRIQVVLPAFWAICLETPVDERNGYVFKLPGRGGGQMTNKRVVNIISEIGKTAGVITNQDTGKHATSHDIGRRAFVPQIDGILTQSEAHKAMGHASWQTTQDYYDTRDALEVSAKLWAPVM